MNKILNEQEKIKMTELRERSGNVTIDSRLVSFLYELMRDHLPTGVVEEIILASENESEVTYSNGYLAKYAEDLANRLKDK
jgi:hypothetical protein